MFMEAPRSSLRVRYGSICCSTAPAAQGLFSCPWGLRLRACTDARASQCSATSTQSENRPTLKAPSLQPLRLRLAPSLKVRLDSTLKPHLCQALKLHLRLRLDMAASVTTLAPAVITPSAKLSMGSTQQAGGSSGGTGPGGTRAPRTASVSLAITPRLTLACHAASAATTPRPLAWGLVGIWGYGPRPMSPSLGSGMTMGRRMPLASCGTHRTTRTSWPLVWSAGQRTSSATKTTHELTTNPVMPNELPL